MGSDSEVLAIYDQVCSARMNGHSQLSRPRPKGADSVAKLQNGFQRFFREKSS
jgi:hypothetical protein